MYLFSETEDRVKEYKPNRHEYGILTSPCGGNCKCCKHISSETTATDHTHQRHMVTSDQRIDTNCASKSVVYGISCKCCSWLLYVGMTTRSLRDRAREHLNNIASNSHQSNYLYKHFRNGNHNLDIDFKIQILYQSTIDDPIARRTDLFDKELLWTKLLNTAYPFGCNDNIKGYGNISQGISPTSFNNHPYHRYPHERQKRSHGKKRRSKRKNQLTVDIWTTVFDELKRTESDPRKQYLYMRSLPQTVLKDLYRKLLSSNSTLSESTILAVFAFCVNLYKEPKKTKASVYRWLVPFQSKGIQELKLETMLKDKRLQRLLPAELPKPISVTYSYDIPCRSILCNYNSFVKKLTLEDAKKITSEICQCQTSKYVYEPAGHVVTGDLTMISDQTLQEAFAKGASYRPPKTIDWNAIDRIIEDSLGKLINWLCHAQSRPINMYQPFKQRFVQLYESRKRYLMTTLQTVQRPELNRTALRQLHRNYIVTVVDKAPNNYILVCKRYYLETICRHLGISTFDWTINGNETYAPTDESKENILERLISASRQFEVPMNPTCNSLATIFPNPKLHKKPYKWRFIASARTSAMKPISSLLDIILSHFKSHFRNYCHQIHKRTGIKCWWSIDNSLEFLQIVDRVNRRKEKVKLFSGDFSDMFTSCKIETIQHALIQIVSICFRNSGKHWLRVNGHNVNYTDKQDIAGKYYKKEEIFELIEYVLKNNYVSFIDMTCHQVQGVPMGLPSAPKMIDLTMAYYEFKFQTDPQNREIALAIGEKTCRYVDDECSLSDYDVEPVLSRIYPPELSLLVTSSDRSMDFLDITITIQNGIIHTQVYNKTDDFPFKIIRYSHIQSNIHERVGYNTFYGELVRFARISSDSKSFESRSKHLRDAHLRNGYELEQLLHTASKFCIQYSTTLTKIGIIDDRDKTLLIQRIFD